MHRSLRIERFILGTVGTYYMKQCRLVIRVEAIVELAHKGGLMHKSKAPYRMDIGEVVLNQATDVPGRRKFGREKPICR